MVNRNISDNLCDAVKDTPVVFLAGSRQTGKSTLIQFLAEKEFNSQYITFDNYTALSAAKNNPKGFIEGLPERIVIDEIQRVPELFLAIKESVDKKRQSGKFILTGSANVLLLPKLSETLTGRMDIQTLWPFSIDELHACKSRFIDILFNENIQDITHSPKIVPDILNHIIQGGYPEVLERKNINRKNAWYKNYITTILQRDIKELSNIDGLIQLPNILQIFAARSACLLNFADISRSLQIPQTSLKRYVSLLESIFIIHRLIPWFKNINLRITKAPKIYVNDTGLLCHLLGVDFQHLKNNRILAGQIFENFVVNELKKQITWSTMKPDIFHFRTSSGREVDIILENNQGLCVGIEVKLSSSVSEKNIAGLKFLKETLKTNFIKGIVIYTGQEIIPFDKDIFAVPVSALLVT